MMKLNKRGLFLLIIVLFAVGLLGAYTGIKIWGAQLSAPNQNSSSNNSNASSSGEMDVVDQVYEMIEDNYVEDADDNELLEGAIQGMLESLDDPYSSYMDAEAMERFDEQIESSFQGIGAEVSMKEGQVTIISPIKDSPAEKAGLRTNDQILQVDDQKLENMDLNEAVEHIRGEKGSEVDLLIQRTGASDPFEVTLTRDEIPIETVEADTEDVDGKKTGIITISSFSETTSDEFTKALDKLEEDGIDGLVIDVRGNPGGLLDSVEEIMEHFVPKDIPYVQVEDRDGHKDKYYSDLEEKKDYPIDIVVDEGSASASEILAVALKEIDYDVIGETSFGKGTVQKAMPLDNGGTLKLTFFKWLSPEGNWIHDEGVEPTVEQKQPDYYYVNPVQIEDTLTFDQTDEQIENVQIMLKGLGFDPGRDDGYFDEKTKQAVKDYQADNDLKETGDIDEETAGKIEADLLDKVRDGEEDLQLEKALDVLYE